MTNGKLPAGFSWAPLAAELIVTDLGRSLWFWRDLIGFAVAYERPGERFAYLDLAGAQVMLSERGYMGRWINAELEAPFGRGINLQAEAADLEPALDRLLAANWPLYIAVEEKWYRAGDIEVGVSQFVVSDPDGYLLRLSQPLGKRVANQASD